MLRDLSPQERLQLLRFVCSFAWADSEVKLKERAFLRMLAARLALTEEERGQLQRCLDVPPETNALDPTRIPLEHRRLFLDEARKVVATDSEVHPDEAAMLKLLEDIAR